MSKLHGAIILAVLSIDRIIDGRVRVASGRGRRSPAKYDNAAAVVAYLYYVYIIL